LRGYDGNGALPERMPDLENGGDFAKAVMIYQRRSKLRNNKTVKEECEKCACSLHEERGLVEIEKMDEEVERG